MLQYRGIVWYDRGITMILHEVEELSLNKNYTMHCKAVLSAIAFFRFFIE